MTIVQLTQERLGHDAGSDEIIQSFTLHNIKLLFFLYG